MGTIVNTWILQQTNTLRNDEEKKHNPKKTIRMEFFSCGLYISILLKLLITAEKQCCKRKLKR